MAFRILFLSLFLLVISTTGIVPIVAPLVEDAGGQNLEAIPKPTQTPSPSPTASPTPCPAVSINAPADLVAPGETVTFTASPPESAGADVLYTWSVSGGRIVSGDGTSSIRVVINAELGTPVQVNLEVQFDSCLVSASVTITTTLPPAGFGSLSGVVRDPQGNMLDGATVTVSLGNDSKAEETTKDGGKYEFSQLIVGEHDVEASHPRFNPDKKTVRIRKNRTTNQDFKLKEK